MRQVNSGILSVRVNVASVERSVEFYRTFLGLDLVGEASPDGAVLDAGTIALVLRRIDGVACTWEEDDLVRGFRHVAFKVADLGELVGRLRRAGVTFRAEPMDTGIGVKTAFFFDPDGTVIEIVEGYVDYIEVTDPALMAAEREPGKPTRPRFDHVATTSRDLEATLAAYAPFGFRRIGALHVPDEPRGFRIDYLMAGPTILEVFTFVAPTRAAVVRPDAYGFAGFTIQGLTQPLFGSTRMGHIDGQEILRDADDLAYALSGA